LAKNVSIGDEAHEFAIGSVVELVCAADEIAQLFTDVDGAVMEDVLTAKGDLFAASAASTPARLGVGANGFVPVADSGETTGIKWAEIISDVCQGRLTLTTATPVKTTDVTAATTVYFTPYKGDKVSLFDGTNWIVHTFAERSLSLSGYTADKNYDIWLYDNAGTLTLDSTVWTDNATRATALVLQDSIYCKTGTLTKRYLGTIRITSTTGQCEDSTKRRLCWNYYNRVPRSCSKYSVGFHTYDSTTKRFFNDDSTNWMDFVIGVPEDYISFHIWSSMKGDGTQNAYSALKCTTVDGATIGVITSNSTYLQNLAGGPVGATYAYLTGYYLLLHAEYMGAAATGTWYDFYSEAVIQG